MFYFHYITMAQIGHVSKGILRREYEDSCALGLAYKRCMLAPNIIAWEELNIVVLLAKWS